MICMNAWARIIGLKYKEFAHMPLGELGDLIEMYQRVNGIAEADELNESEFIPSLK